MHHIDGQRSQCMKPLCLQLGYAAEEAHDLLHTCVVSCCWSVSAGLHCKRVCFLTFNQIVFCIEDLLRAVELAYVYDLGTQKPSPGVHCSLINTGDRAQASSRARGERCMSLTQYL